MDEVCESSRQNLLGGGEEALYVREGGEESCAKKCSHHIPIQGGKAVIEFPSTLSGSEGKMACFSGKRKGVRVPLD